MTPKPPRRPNDTLLWTAVFIFLWVLVFVQACGTETGKWWN